MRSLKKNPKSTGPGLGEVIADSFRDYFAKADRSSGSEVTLSVINPTQVQTVEKAILNLSRTLAVQLQDAGPEAWQRIARARARTLTFGGDGDDENSPSLLDLVHLTQELRKEFSNSPVAPACDAVAEAVRGVVVHNVRGKERIHANGLSIFFPPDVKSLKGDEDDSYPVVDIVKRGHSLPFLSRYATLAAGQEQRPLLKEIRADGQLVDDERNVVVKCKVSAEVDRADFAVALERGPRHVIVGCQSSYADDSNDLEETWTGSWYTLKVGEKEITCPIVDRGDEDEDSASNAEVPVQIRRGGKGNWHYANLVFSIDDDADEVDGELVRTYTRARSRVWELKLRRGDEIRPMQDVIEANGVRNRVRGGADQVLVVDDPKAVRLGDDQLEPGTYQVGYLASDGGGASSTTSSRSSSPSDVPLKREVST